MTLDDISDYQTDLPSNAGAWGHLSSSSARSRTVMMSCKNRPATGAMNIYRRPPAQKLEQAAGWWRDQFACKVSQLLKSVRVLLWLIAEANNKKKNTATLENWWNKVVIKFRKNCRDHLSETRQIMYPFESGRFGKPCLKLTISEQSKDLSQPGQFS